MVDMNVYVYPNTSNDDSIADDAKNGLETGLEDVVSNTNIGTYDVTVRYDHPNVADGSYDECYNGFPTWRNNNYPLEDGCHLCISANFDGGRADGGNTSNPEEDAFVSAKDAVAGSHFGSTGNFQNTCLHEVFHTFIDKDLSRVQSLMGPSNSEHSLGEVNDSGATPMIVGYRDEYGGEGTCSLDQGVSGYTQSPTYCTNQSLEATAEDENII